MVSEHVRSEQVDIGSFLREVITLTIGPKEGDCSSNGNSHWRILTATYEINLGQRQDLSKQGTTQSTVHNQSAKRLLPRTRLTSGFPKVERQGCS